MNNNRLLSLDILRGITVAGMILVNNGWGESFEMLEHSAWNGMTPCDLVLNIQRTYGNWSPRNGSHARYGELVPLKWGLAHASGIMRSVTATLWPRSAFRTG